ncbi:MAG: outer membrane beta-barrel protein [Bdellovibrionota bacterium]
MKRGIFGLLFAATLLSASPAFAIFNVQVLGGQRSSEFKNDSSSIDLSGSELRFAAHLDPIPLVPVGFGVAFAQTTFDEDGTKVDGTDIDLELEAWLPLEIAGLVPFAKIGYTVGGEYEVEFDDLAGVKSKFKPSGASLHVGIKYEFLLRIGIMAEVEFANRELDYDSTSGAPANLQVEADDSKQKSTSILIGAQAGI